MDVNGGKKPNSETVDNKMHDIRSFNLAKIKGCAGTDVIGIGCVVQVKTYQPITDPEESEFIATYCEIAAQHCRDYWLSAVNACKKLGDNYELPSKSVLNAINNQKNIYTTLPQDGIFWSSSTRNSHTGFYVDFTNSSNRDYDVFSTKHGVLCVGD